MWCLIERSLDVFIWPSVPDFTSIPSFCSNAKSANNNLTAYSTKLFRKQVPEEKSVWQFVLHNYIYRAWALWLVLALDFSIKWIWKTGLHLLVFFKLTLSIVCTFFFWNTWLAWFNVEQLLWVSVWHMKNLWSRYW